MSGVKPGLAQRMKELKAARTTERSAVRKRSLFSLPDLIVGPTNPEGQKRQQAERAYKRQSNVDVDEPAVEGSQRPSEIKRRPGELQRERERDSAARAVSFHARSQAPLEGDEETRQELDKMYLSSEDALERQRRVRQDKPAVKGSKKPSEIRRLAALRQERKGE